MRGVSQRALLIISSCWLLMFCAGTSHGRTYTPSGLRSRLGGMLPVSTSAQTPKPLLFAICSRARFLTARLLEFTIASEGITLASQGLGLKPSTVLILINTAVHVSWRCILNEAMHHPKFEHNRKWMNDRKISLERWKWMDRNFCMPKETKELVKCPHTILLSGFSHKDFSHLRSNMVGLQLFAPPVARILGTRTFSRFYVSSFYASTFVNLWVIEGLSTKTKASLGIFEKRFEILHRLLSWVLRIRKSSLGASGAICSVHMFFCVAFPPTLAWTPQQNNDTIRKDVVAHNDGITKSPRFARILVSILLLVPDIFDTDRSSNEGIDRGAHLAGYAFGLIFYCLLQLPFARDGTFLAWTAKIQKMAGEKIGAFRKNLQRWFDQQGSNIDLRSMFRPNR
jgi:membrane associated rhomboid family serine protease